MSRTITAPAHRAVIRSVNEQGILVEVAPQCWETFAWTRVRSVVGLMIDHQYGARVMMVSIEVGPGEAILLYELDAAWSNVVETLHLYLPEAIPFGQWGVALLSRPGMIRIYGD